MLAGLVTFNITTRSSCASYISTNALLPACASPAACSIEVVSEEFAGISIVKQHQLVTRLLKDEISQWHGFQLVTKAPAQ